MTSSKSASSKQTRKIAFLGPSGTHSHRALLAFCAEAESIAFKNISEVFLAVSNKEVDAAFVPLENIIEGPVNSTLDQLLKFRKEVFIKDSFLSTIEHSLGSLAKVATSEIPAIYSHPQALGQCAGYLEKNTPQSTLCSIDSTAAAVELVKKENLQTAGVIAHAETLKENGFSIVANNISNIKDNKTRFVLIEKGQADLKSAIDEEDNSSSKQFVTSILVHPGKDRRGLLHEILELISVRFRVNLNSINSRPDPSGGYVFYLELQGHPNSQKIKHCLKELERYADVVTGDTVEISVFGGYQRTAQTKKEELKVGIIGGKGSMGGLFQKLFSEAGYQVMVSDKGTELNNKQLAAKADIIILSLPMETISEVSKEISTHLKPGQLVIENCSVKESALQTLESTLAEGIEILGLHTLFGNCLDSFDGQNIIITQSKRSGKLASKIEELFYQAGARITHLSPENHDAHAAVMQTLTHAVLISYGSTMADANITRADHDNFSTPNSRALFYALERVSGLSNELVRDLQLQNPQADKVRENFAKVVNELAESLNKKDDSLLIAALEKCKALTKRDFS